MTYLQLKNDRLRISLTKHESEQIFGNTESLDKNDPRTQIALKMLLKRVIHSGNIALSCNSVWVEVAKNISGGYDIYFIKSRFSTREVSSVLILDFSSCDCAITAAKTVNTLKGRCETSFYKFDDRYRIIAKTENGILDLPGILEFADSIYCSAEKVAETREHGKEIIALNAIETLSML